MADLTFLFLSPDTRDRLGDMLCLVIEDIDEDRDGGDGRGDGVLDRPLGAVVGVFALELHAHGGAGCSVDPFAGVALGRPFAHAGDIRDGVIDGLG